MTRRNVPAFKPLPSQDGCKWCTLVVLPIGFPFYAVLSYQEKPTPIV